MSLAGTASTKHCNLSWTIRQTLPTGIHIQCNELLFPKLAFGVRELTETRPEADSRPVDDYASK